ncbi:MAG: type VI secretion system baseplate subunit TssE, partial [Pseudomonadota bacterium]|nr:type VI secretion system baseplate subunit TssE [Pseudomonadota bacterium]
IALEPSTISRNTQARARRHDMWHESVTRDLEALLNTRCALCDAHLEDYPSVMRWVWNYGLIDFAGMCITSDTDQHRIYTAVRLATERHEPRLKNVAVVLQKTRAQLTGATLLFPPNIKRRRI